VDAPLALYRRYRPETFSEVIGQDHVTEPLRHALEANRVHHAYLFSGPRGCGKTTSARILARALNCEQGPVAEPCGQCQSCRDLARNGPGSVDVIEIDAATHGRVDDARDLRERAFFSPASSRYKIYIVDEAHMVTTEGFNALLKLVEEPPPHLKFVFATTEPNKVISTIRSRTHHYPFRLVPPKVLSDYLARLCSAEDVTLDENALPLVVRAGGGSVRDSLSILDQLLAGAGPGGLTYELATSLLGYTPEALLDEVIDALAAGDGATVFGVVDKVIESGQEPRRFTEDLLQRLRDLIIASAVPTAFESGLLQVPEDLAERLQRQASTFGNADLARCADIVSAGLVDFRGATAPRMLLELMCARMLLPAADHGTDGLAARLDRLERRLDIQRPAHETEHMSEQIIESSPEPSGPTVSPSQVEPSPEVEPPEVPSQAEAAPGAQQESVDEVERDEEDQPTESQPKDDQASEDQASSVAASAEPSTDEEPPPHEEAEPARDQSSHEAHAAGAGHPQVSDVRQLWPTILEAVSGLRRFTWVMLNQNAQVIGISDDAITLGLVNAGARDSFVRSGSDEILRQALHQVLGVQWRVETVVDPSAQPGAEPELAGDAQPSPGESASGDRGAPASVHAAIARGAEDTTVNPDSDVDINDPEAHSEAVNPEELVSRELGAEVIDEFHNEPR